MHAAVRGAVELLLRDVRQPLSRIVDKVPDGRVKSQWPANLVKKDEEFWTNIRY